MKNETFKELLASVKEGGQIVRGERTARRIFRIDNPDVVAIRTHLGLTQRSFAALMGISAATLRNWEQGRRRPEGAARVLLCIAARHPKILLETVHSS